jgi:general secretion pathway protein E
MGVEPFLVSSVVRAIVAQRLIRVICPECKEGYVPEAEALRDIGIVPEQLEGGMVYRGKGCPACSETGYRGRTGIYEMLIVSEAIRHLIMKKADSTSICRQAVEEGMKTLRDDGAQEVIAGVTTLEEVARVTQE